DGRMSFAMGDVMGKGIRAGVGMSMIKLGMECYGHWEVGSDGLKGLKGVVEKKVKEKMLVRMLYGVYEEMNDVL
ncbi:SpoIIE family protein phosphatase, partial [Staphylococcus auricularis]|uniref:SpoIIE family protein phosphatase n=1 Tax=Staphylococcus auricularis TaxID=29379 RepID=UPI001246510B